MRYLVFLDAGHGYNTAGKRTPTFDDGNFMRENEFNRVVVKYIYNKLEGYENIDAIIVNSEKYDVSLNERIRRINSIYDSYKAIDSNVKAVLISIHANAYGDGKIFNKTNGTSSHFYKGNMIDKHFTEIIHKNLCKAINLYDRGCVASDFQIIRNVKVTACLCECAFMTNKNDAKLLKSYDFRMKCAEGVCNGILEYFNIGCSKQINYTVVKRDHANGYVYEFKEKSSIKTKYGVSEYNDGVRYIKLHPLNMAIWEGKTLPTNSLHHTASYITKVGYGTNGIFFGYGKQKYDGKDIAVWSHAGILAMGDYVLNEYGCNAAPWVDKNTHKEQGCLVYHKDGTFSIQYAKYLREIKGDYYWVIGCISLYPELNPKREGCENEYEDKTGIWRYTDHTTIGITEDNYIILARSYQCYRVDTIKHMRDLGCKLILGLDGGGSTQYRVPGLQRPTYNLRAVPSMLLATDLI